MVVVRQRENGDILVKDTNSQLCKMNEFWRSNVQCNDYDSQYCMVYLKFVRGFRS